MASDLQERRLAVVREHMASENEHRFDDTMATFDHPRYEIMASGEVYERIYLDQGTIASQLLSDPPPPAPPQAPAPPSPAPGSA